MNKQKLYIKYFHYLLSTKNIILIFNPRKKKQILLNLKMGSILGKENNIIAKLRLKGIDDLKISKVIQEKQKIYQTKIINMLEIFFDSGSTNNQLLLFVKPNKPPVKYCMVCRQTPKNLFFCHSCTYFYCKDEKCTKHLATAITTTTTNEREKDFCSLCNILFCAYASSKVLIPTTKKIHRNNVVVDAQRKMIDLLFELIENFLFFEELEETDNLLIKEKDNQTYARCSTCKRNYASEFCFICKMFYCVDCISKNKHDSVFNEKKFCLVCSNLSRFSLDKPYNFKKKKQKIYNRNKSK